MKQTTRPSSALEVTRELRWLRVGEAGDRPPAAGARRLDPTLRASMIALVARNPWAPAPGRKQSRNAFAARTVRRPAAQAAQRRRPALKVELLQSPRRRAARFDGV